MRKQNAIPDTWVDPVRMKEAAAPVWELMKALGKGASNLVSDKPSEGLQDTLLQPDDLIPGVKAATGIGMLAAGTLKHQWPRVMALLGHNPLYLSKKELGQAIANAGPKVRDTNANLIGSQMKDELLSEHPPTLANLRFSKEGITPADRPAFRYEKDLMNNMGADGYFNRHTNEIVIDPLTDQAGVTGHEAQHAIDYIKHNFSGTPEMLPRRPFKNDNLAWDGLFEERRIADFLAMAKNDSALKAKLPSYISEALDNSAASPAHLAEILKWDTNLHKAIANVYRPAVGNKGNTNQIGLAGFSGNNHYLADVLHTKGHFRAPIEGEMSLAPHHMAKQEARLGNLDMHPDWINSEVKQAHVPTPQVQVKLPAPEVEALPSKAALAPMVGLGLGAAALTQFSDDRENASEQGSPKEVTSQYDDDLLHSFMQEEVTKATPHRRTPTPKPSPKSTPKANSLWDRVEQREKERREAAKELGLEYLLKY